MKPGLTAAMLAITALMLGATLVLTCGELSSPSPSFGTASMDQRFVSSKPTPIYLDKSITSQPLQPGVYQTYPYTIILIVPGRGIDDRSFAEIPNANSKMPIIKPPVKVIPLSEARP
jgi:hypothetical protein